MKTLDSESVLEPLDFEAEQVGVGPVVVCVPTYPDLQQGDRLEVYWAGAAYPEELDPKLEFKVGSSALESAGGGQISLSYTVRR